MARLKNFQNEPITSNFKYHKVIDGQDLDTQCSWNKFKGERCPKKGTMSDNTNGYPPYYCSEHCDFVHNRVDDPRPNAKKRGFVDLKSEIEKIKKTRTFF